MQTTSVSEAGAEPVEAERRHRRPFLRRRRFLVDPQLQLGLLAVFLFGVFIFAASLTVFLFAPAAVVLLGERGDQAETLRHAQQVMALDARWWPALAMSFVLIMLLGLRTTHRLAGPLYRFRCVMRELASTGTARPFKLRKGDRLQIEATMLNAVIVRLQDDAAARRETARSLRRSCADAARLPGDAERLRDLLVACERAADQLEGGVRDDAAGA